MTDQTTTPDRMLIDAVAWIEAHGDLVGFRCPDAAVPGLFSAMRARGLIAASASRPMRKRLTPAGQALLKEHRDGG